MIGLIALAGFIAAWWGVVKIGKRNNMRKSLRHVLGFVAGFFVLGFFAAIDQQPKEEPEGASVSETTPVVTEPDVALLDGAVPDLIQKMLSGDAAQMAISNGVLEIKLSSPSKVEEDVFRRVVLKLMISRWFSEGYLEYFDKEDESDSPGELPEFWSDIPNWSGIVTVNVSNSSGTQGLTYNAGDDGFGKLVLGLKPDAMWEHIQQHTVAFGELTKADKDAICRQDAECWAKEHIVTANAQCGYAIEQLAQYQSKWTNGWSERKFHHYIWKDQDRGIIIYGGDRIQFQNGFGAWQPHRYVCEFDTLKNQLIDVAAEPGRF